MTKLEMAKKLHALSDENGNVKLDDFTNLLVESDSPQDVVDNFLKDADSITETFKLMSEVSKISMEISSKQNDLNNLTNDFNEKYDRLKSITQKIGLDKYINLP